MAGPLRGRIARRHRASFRFSISHTSGFPPPLSPPHQGEGDDCGEGVRLGASSRRSQRLDISERSRPSSPPPLWHREGGMAGPWRKIASRAAITRHSGFPSHTRRGSPRPCPLPTRGRGTTAARGAHRRVVTTLATSRYFRALAPFVPSPLVAQGGGDGRPVERGRIPRRHRASFRFSISHTSGFPPPLSPPHQGEGDDCGERCASGKKRPGALEERPASGPSVFRGRKVRWQNCRSATRHN